MKATGMIVCKREPVWIDETRRVYEPPDDWFVTCEWQGGRIGLISWPLLQAMEEGECDAGDVWKIEGNVWQFAQYRIRIVGVHAYRGASTDTFYMMQDGWLARLTEAYIRNTRQILLDLANCEMRLDRFLGRRKEGMRLEASTFFYKQLPLLPVNL